MARIPALGGRQFIRILRAHGYVPVSQRGSHVKLRRGEVTVIVPVHGSRPLKRATLLGILSDAGLGVQDLP